MMRQAMIGANNILHDPAPVVALKSVDALAIEVELQFHVRRLADRTSARNELIDLVYRQCLVTGISLALPASSAVFVENLQAGHALPETLQELLQSNPIFAGLKQEELQKLETSARLTRSRPGDVLVNGADSLPNLTIIRSGAVAVFCDGAEDIRLAAGAIFGQIDSIDSEARYEALTDLEAYEIDGPAFASLLRDHPEIQDSLSRHLSALARNSSAMGSKPAEGGHASALLRTLLGR